MYSKVKIRDYQGEIKKRWCVYWFEDRKRKVIWISIKLDRAGRYVQAHKIKTEVESKLNGTFVTNDTPIIDALNEILTFFERDVSLRTLQSYQAEVHKLIDWLKQKKLHRLKISEFNENMAKKFYNEVYFIQKISNKTINSYVGYLKTIFNRISKQYVRIENPFVWFHKMHEDEPQIVVWDEQNKQRLSTYLKQLDSPLRLAVLFIYHCFIRPNEARQLQFKDIDLKRGIVRVKSTIAKNNRVRYPTMSEQIIEILTPMVAMFPADFYIFSKKLQPGFFPVSRNIISNYFRKVRIDAGIPNYLNMYAFKHTGNTEMLEKGATLEDLMLQNGHHDFAITRKYIKRLYSKANQKFATQSEDF